MCDRLWRGKHTHTHTLWIKLYNHVAILCSKIFCGAQVQQLNDWSALKSWYRLISYQHSCIKNTHRNHTHKRWNYKHTIVGAPNMSPQTQYEKDITTMCVGTLLMGAFSRYSSWVIATDKVKGQPTPSAKLVCHSYSPSNTQWKAHPQLKGKSSACHY